MNVEYYYSMFIKGTKRVKRETSLEYSNCNFCHHQKFDNSDEVCVFVRIFYTVCLIVIGVNFYYFRNKWKKMKREKGKKEHL